MVSLARQVLGGQAGHFDLRPLCIKGDLRNIKEYWNRFHDQLEWERGPEGTRPLHEAARHGHVEVVSFLLSKGAKINPAASFNEATPLYMASEARQKECQVLLLHHQASAEGVYETRDGAFLRVMTGADGDVPQAEREVLLQKGLVIAAQMDLVDLIEKLLPRAYTLLAPAIKEAENYKKHRSIALLKIAQAVVTCDVELLAGLYGSSRRSSVPQEVRAAVRLVPTSTLIELTKVKFDHRIYRELLIHTRKNQTSQGLEINWSSLSVYDNCVEDLYVIQAISSASSLSLAHNDLTCIGENIGILENLRVLDLSSNSINEISSSLFCLPCLWSLNLSENLLSNLPSLDQDAQLTHLDLSSNKFQKVPNSVKNLPALSYLNISHNTDIWCLPLWLSSLESLEDLRMEGLDHIDRNLKDCSTEEARTYLQSQLENSRKLYEMKLIVTGTPKAGKTAFVNCLRDALPALDEATPTKTVSVSHWLYKQSKESKEYEFIVWDVKSSDPLETRNIEELIYTPFGLYLILFDVTSLVEDLNLIQQKLDAIAKYCLPSCVLFIGTHVDLVDEGNSAILDEAKTHLTDMISNYPKDLIFAKVVVETVSLATGNVQNMEKVRSTIFDLAGRLRHSDGLSFMGRRVLLSGLGLKGEVEEYCRQASQGKKLPILTYEEIEKIVSNLKDNEVRSHDELENISHFLNQVGCLLRYTDTRKRGNAFHPIPPTQIINSLQDSYFMDPDWLYRNAQAVMRYVHPTYNGLFHYKDIEEYLHGTNECWSIGGEVISLMPLLAVLVHFDFLVSFNDTWFANPMLFKHDTISPSISHSHFPHIQHYVVEVPRDFTTFLITVINRVLPLEDYTTCPSGNDSGLACWSRGVAWSNFGQKICIEETREEKDVKDLITLTIKYTSPFYHAHHLEELSTLIEESFPTASVSYTCTTCIAETSNEMQSFTLSELVAAIVRESDSVTCRDGHSVPLRLIAPFLSVHPTHTMTQLRTDLQSMKYSNSESQYRLLFKGVYKGQNVHVFKYHKLTENSLRELTSKSLSLIRYNTPCITNQDGRLLALAINKTQALLVCKTPLLRVSPSQVTLPKKLDMSKSFVLHRIAVILAKALTQFEAIDSDDEGELHFWSLEERSLTICSLALSDVTLRKIRLQSITGRDGGNDVEGEENRATDESEDYPEKHKMNIWNQCVTSLAQSSSLANPLYLMKVLKSSSTSETLIELLLQSFSSVLVQLIVDTQSINGLQLPMLAASMPSLCGSANGVVADLWMASLYQGKEELRISVYDIINHSMKIFKVKSSLTDVLAIEVCSDHVWVSTQLPDDVGCISIFNSSSKKLVHNIKMTGNAITCIERLASEVCMGTKAGFLFIFPANVANVKSGSPKPRHKFIADGCITGLASMGDRLYIAHSDCIYVFDPVGMIFLSSFCARSDGVVSKDNQIGCLYMSQCEPVLYSVSYGSNVIRVWDIAEAKHLYDIKVQGWQGEGERREQDGEGYITSLTSSIDTIWVGLSNGHILVYHSETLILSMHPYQGPVCFLSRFIDGRGCSIISGGEGFISPICQFDSKYSKDFPVLVLWKVYPTDTLLRLKALEESGGKHLDNYSSLTSLIDGGYGFTGNTTATGSPSKQEGMHFEPLSPTKSVSSNNDDDIPIQLSNGTVISLPLVTSMSVLYESILSQSVEYDLDALIKQNLVYYYQAFDTPISISTDDDLLSYLELPDRPILMLID